MIYLSCIKFGYCILNCWAFKAAAFDFFGIVEYGSRMGTIFPGTMGCHIASTAEILRILFSGLMVYDGIR